MDSIAAFNFSYVFFEHEHIIIKHYLTSRPENVRYGLFRLVGRAALVEKFDLDFHMLRLFSDGAITVPLHNKVSINTSDC